MKVDFSEFEPVRKPTRKERGLYIAWRTYLKDSKLTGEEIHKRASEYAARHDPVPKD